MRTIARRIVPALALLACAAWAGEHTIPSGTVVEVRSNGSIDAKSAAEGHTYPAVINSDVIGSDGNVAIPKGSDAQLIVRKVSSSELALDLQSVTVHGRQYLLQTGDVSKTRRQGVGKNKRTAEMVGGGAVLGTIVGAIAGGGKGAAIGAATGAAAGAATQTITRGSEIKVPAETLLTFRLTEPVHLDSVAGSSNR